MAPSLLASFPTFPSLALPGPSSLPCSSSYDPIHGSRGRDFGFDDDDDEADEYENCLCPGRKYPRTTRMYTSNNNHNTSFSGRASRLTRRISGSSSCSSLSSLSSKTGGLTKGARKFVRNLVRCSPYLFVCCSWSFPFTFSLRPPPLSPFSYSLFPHRPFFKTMNYQLMDNHPTSSAQDLPRTNGNVLKSRQQLLLPLLLPPTPKPQS